MEYHQGYGPKTLTTGWDCDDSGQKDFDAYHPPGGNQFRSSYKFFGTEEQASPLKSETGETQAAVLTQPKVTPARRPLVNMLTFPATIGFHRERFWAECKILPPPDSAYRTDYESVFKKSYIDFNPTRPRSVDRERTMKPVTRFRRLLVDGADPRRPGLNAFYDDNQDYLHRSVSARSPAPFAYDYTPSVI